MSSALQPVRGTHDIFPAEARIRRFIEDTARAISGRYGFGEIRTPVFEFSEVFHRTLGDASDIVSKETYTFTDRGGESLTLRPEFTASVVRAFITAKLFQEVPLKYFYTGPAFRYERPQKGRMRQFHQLGAELLGAPEPEADAEIIALSAHILRALGLKDKVILELNSLGDTQSRQNYRSALVDYLTAHRNTLSEESRVRLEKNPLRVLDSKDANDKKIVAGAPKLSGHYTEEARVFFARVCELLGEHGIAYTISDTLVRGLDYYNHTVFEFTTDALGAQNTVLAGGRYDGLVEMMGGPKTAGVGFAAGIERIQALMETAGSELPPEPAIIALVPIAEAQESAARSLAQQLREEGLTVEIAYKGNAGKRMKRADKLGAAFALMLGEEEAAKGTVTLKTLATGEQQAIPRDALLPELRRRLSLATNR